MSANGSLLDLVGIYASNQLNLRYYGHHFSICYNGYHCLHFVMYVLHEMNGGLATLNFIVYDSFV